ncbi:Uncharacterised protein [Kingella potus]|uniref:NemA protein n=1 Tax=Kingella potus TaxID=265175 RepID=A0A377R3B8_9NEIS|nr:NemA protein [Kingella potus]STR03287.1 Uncharacterised protein [Kingella potus]
MKNILLLSLAAITLTACSGSSVNLGIGGFGRHLGLGTSVSIPVGGKKTPSDADIPDTAKEQTVVVRFAADGQATDSPAKGGSYRQLLGKRSDSEYLVQDFYEDGGAKRTDPMVLTRQALFSADAHPQDGTLTVYSPDGKILRHQLYRNGQPAAQQ